VTVVAVGNRIAQPERSVNEEEAGSQSGAVNQFKSRGPHNRYLTPHEQGQVPHRGRSNLLQRDPRMLLSINLSLVGRTTDI
jgi:hypothetical protein